MEPEKSTPTTRSPGTKTCPHCGVAFVCGMAAGEKHCWCADLPPLLPVPLDGTTGCLCPACLQVLTKMPAGPA